MSIHDIIQRVTQGNSDTQILDLRNLASLEVQQITSIVEAIIESKNSSITSIALDELDICDDGAKELARLGHVKHLSLSDGKITAEGAEYLSKMLFLETLDLSGNNIGDKGLKAILENQSIQKLYLASCGLTDKSALSILDNNHLIEIVLYNNKISLDLLSKIQEHLEKNQRVLKPKNSATMGKF